jgi:DNA-binding transcriptional ArsR family regulator
MTIPAMTLEDAADCLEALGNSTRLCVYRTLVMAGDSGRSVGELQRELGVPGSTLTHHLKRLIGVGLIAQERRGATLICRANYPAMDAIVAYLTSECCVDAIDDGSEAA